MEPVFRFTVTSIGVVPILSLWWLNDLFGAKYGDVIGARAESCGVEEHEREQGEGAPRYAAKA